MLNLLPHPDTPPAAVNAVDVALRSNGSDLGLTFRVAGASRLNVPALLPAGRADDLWQTTCFELFLTREDDPGYYEFNFSPSTRWAAYRFEGHRQGRCDVAMLPAPDVRGVRGADCYELTVALAGLPVAATCIGVSVVIEEIDGTKSYWALAHAAGPPDFHNRDCFIATLPAPTAA